MQNFKPKFVNFEEGEEEEISSKGLKRVETSPKGDRAPNKTSQMLFEIRGDWSPQEERLYF